jgi:hypothetical protein
MGMSDWLKHANEREHWRKRPGVGQFKEQPVPDPEGHPLQGWAIECANSGKRRVYGSMGWTASRKLAHDRLLKAEQLGQRRALKKIGRELGNLIPVEVNTAQEEGQVEALAFAVRRCRELFDAAVGEDSEVKWP